MARSSITLAALATAAVPDVVVVGAGPLTTGTNGAFDAALLRTAEGADRVVRVATSERAASDQSIELLALGAMTVGIRSRLPFAVPTVLGHAPTRLGRAVVTDYLPGAAAPSTIPAGDGIATSIGAAIAAIHSLPGSFVGEAGLPTLTAGEARNEARNVIDRAIATKRLPAAVRDRWRDAVEDDELWQFHPTVVNGALDAGSFLVDAHEAGPVVSGIVGWSGLRVSDPARDLHWLSSAGAAADDVIAAYEQHRSRHPDARIRQRALLHAELELARWLLHGRDTHDEAIVDDAIEMLDGLVDSVLARRAGSIGPDTGPVLAVGEVEELLEHTPRATEPTGGGIETDAYDPDEWGEDEIDPEAARSALAGDAEPTDETGSSPDAESRDAGDGAARDESNGDAAGIATDRGTSS